ncbi:MAG: hypothetical protein ACM31I_06065 [Deltaproteobacteria bacterium]
MDRYLFMKPVIDRLAQGPFFRRNLALCVRIAAAAAAMAALVEFVEAWNFTSRLEAGRIPGGIVYMLSLAAAAYMVVHAMLIRANDIASLPQTGYTLIPVAGVVFPMIGEAYGAACAALGAGGGVLIWFAGDTSYNVLHRVSFFIPFQGGGTFTAGILYILRGALRAVVALCLGYLFSELSLVVERLGGNAPREASGGE